MTNKLHTTKGSAQFVILIAQPLFPPRSGSVGGWPVEERPQLKTIYFKMSLNIITAARARRKKSDSSPVKTVLGSLNTVTVKQEQFWQSSNQET